MRTTMIENVPIQDTLCTKLARIEHLEGGLMRFWFCVEQHEASGEIEHIVNLKLVLPASTVPGNIFQTIGALGGHVEQVPRVMSDRAH